MSARSLYFGIESSGGWSGRSFPPSTSSSESDAEEVEEDDDDDDEEDEGDGVRLRCFRFLLSFLCFRFLSFLRLCPCSDSEL